MLRNNLFVVLSLFLIAHVACKADSKQESHNTLQTEPIVDINKDSLAWIATYNTHTISAYDQYMKDHANSYYFYEADYWKMALQRLEGVDKDLTKLTAKASHFTRNILYCHVDSEGHMNIQNKRIKDNNYVDIIKEFIINPAKRPQYSADPTEAIIYFSYDQSLPIEKSQSIYNDLRNAYVNLWNEKATYKHGKKRIIDLKQEYKNAIRAELPFNLVVGPKKKKRIPPPPKPVIHKVNTN